MWVNSSLTSVSVFTRGLELQTQELVCTFNPKMGSPHWEHAEEGHKYIVMANSSKSSDWGCTSGSRHNKQRKPRHILDGNHFLSGAGSRFSHPVEGSEQNMMKREMRGTLGERWARERMEERRERVRRDLGKQTERHPWINSGIIWITSLLSHYTYFSEALGKIRHVISFWIIQGKARLKLPGLGGGAPWGGWGGGEPLYKIPMSKGLGAQVMHKAPTVCPHCLLHKRGWDWEKGGSFQDTGQQLLECPDPPSLYML